MFNYSFDNGWCYEDYLQEAFGMFKDCMPLSQELEEERNMKIEQKNEEN